MVQCVLELARISRENDGPSISVEKFLSTLEEADKLIDKDRVSFSSASIQIIVDPKPFRFLRIHIEQFIPILWV